MSSIIKASQRQQGVTGVSFNFDDMAVQANHYLDKVRDQATQIVAEAQRKADQIRQQAEQQGKQAAQKQLQQLVDQEVGRRAESVLPALQQAVRQIQDSRHAWLSHWERAAVHVAARMAARVCRRQLDFTPQVSQELVQEALRLAAGSAEVRLLLHPQDHQALASHLERWVAEIGGLAQADIVADASISPGGCLVETRLGRIDQRFESQLARLEEELND